MDRAEVFKKVSAIVADHFEVDRAKITDNLNLRTDLNLFLKLRILLAQPLMMTMLNN